jgi:CBS domain-containing protein
MFEIENIMTKEVISVKKDTAIQETIKIMVENNITGLPVVDDQMQLIGVISEKDIMMLLYDVGSRTGKVEDFMTKNVVCFDQQDCLADVCDCLLKNHFRRVPIVSGSKKKLVGIISRKNIVQSIFQYQDFFRDTPYMQDELADARVQVEQLKSTSN